MLELESEPKDIEGV